jgi:hypothetical protein
MAPVHLSAESIFSNFEEKKMIKLEKPIVSFWHPQGDKDGNPVKVDVDHAFVNYRCLDDCPGSPGRLEAAVKYGYVYSGTFTAYIQPSGQQDYPVFTITDNDPKKPQARAFSDFLASVAKKGAPAGDFRKSDIEQMLIDGGFIAGEIATE